MKTSSFEKELRRFDWVARTIWPCVRLLFKKHLSPRCQKCLLSESVVPLTEDGICLTCKTYKPIKKKSSKFNSKKKERELNQLFKSHCGKGKKKYDALLLFSGGKDSTYLLHRMKKDYPRLRILTVLVDNGFMSPIALENANTVVKKTKGNHLHFRLKNSFVKKVFRYALLNLHKQRLYSLVDFLDGMMTFHAARIIAAKNQIPLVLCGLGKVQIENVFNPNHFELTHEDEKQALKKIGGIAFSTVYKTSAKDLWWNPKQWPRSHQPRFIIPFTAWDPDETFIKKEVAKLDLLDLKRTSPLLTNNKLIPVISMAEMARFGYSVFEIEFASMIRQGKSERSYWVNLFEMLEVSAKSGLFINQSLKDTLKELGLTPKKLKIGTGYA